jgi:hypothetical protein
LGFAASLLPVVLWVGAIWSAGHHEIVVRLVKEHFLGPLLHGWSFDGAWWYYCIALPLMLLPWVVLIFFPNWLGFFSKGTFRAIAGAFRGAYQGLAFVWLSLICAGAWFIFLSPKQPQDLLPLFPPLAVIAGRLVLSLSPLRNMLLQRFLALFLILACLIFAVLPVYLNGQALSVLGWIGSLGIPVLHVQIGGVYIMAAACLAAGCLFIGGISSRRPEGTLLVMLLLAAVLAYPVCALAAPSLDKILSPEGDAQQTRRYVDEGYAAFRLGVKTAPFVYYSDGAGLTALRDAVELESRLLEKKKFILLVGENEWNRLEPKPPLAKEKSFWLAGERYVLFVHDREETSPGAADPGEPPGAPDRDSSAPAPNPNPGL